MQQLRNIDVGITQLTQVSSTEAGDFFIVDTPDGVGIIDYKDVSVERNASIIQPVLDDISSSIEDLSSKFIYLDEDIYEALEQMDVVNSDVAVLKNITTLSSMQTFEGDLRVLPVNFIEVNRITQQQSFSANNSCDTLVYDTGVFALEAGDYKIRVDARVTSLCASPSWMQILLYQDTAPQRVLLYGSSTATFDTDQVKNLFLEYHFNLCRASQISVRAKTRGMFNLGMPAQMMIDAVGTTNVDCASSLQLSSCNMNISIQKIPGLTINPFVGAFVPTISAPSPYTIAIPTPPEPEDPGGGDPGGGEGCENYTVRVDVLSGSFDGSTCEGYFVGNVNTLWSTVQETFDYLGGSCTVTHYAYTNWLSEECGDPNVDDQCDGYTGQALLLYDVQGTASFTTVQGVVDRMKGATGTAGVGMASKSESDWYDDPALEDPWNHVFPEDGTFNTCQFKVEEINRLLVTSAILDAGPATGAVEGSFNAGQYNGIRKDLWVRFDVEGGTSKANVSVQYYILKVNTTNNMIDYGTMQTRVLDPTEKNNNIIKVPDYDDGDPDGFYAYYFLLLRIFGS